MKKFLLITLMTLTSNLFAGDIIGTIKDKETGKDLIGAIALVVGSSLGTVSGFGGDYKLYANDVSDYTDSVVKTIRFSMSGYKSEYMTFVLKNDENAKIDVVLERGVDGENIIFQRY